MEVIVSRLVTIMLSVVILVAMMVLTLGVGWASGKIIRRLLGIGGK